MAHQQNAGSAVTDHGADDVGGSRQASSGINTIDHEGTAIPALPVCLDRRICIGDAARKVNECHRQAREAAGRAVEFAIAAGRALIAAKELVGHGGWADWLRANIEFSDRTARLYMHVAETVPILPEEDRQRVANLSLRQAIAELSSRARIVAKIPSVDHLIETAPADIPPDDITRKQLQAGPTSTDRQVETLKKVWHLSPVLKAAFARSNLKARSRFIRWLEVGPPEPKEPR
jgi:hypothetical protein